MQYSELAVWLDFIPVFTDMSCSIEVRIAVIFGYCFSIRYIRVSLDNFLRVDI